MDLTLVWLLGFIPVWILGVVDYHGGRVIELQRVRWPTSLAVMRLLADTFKAHGPPARLLTDNASIFRSEMFEDFRSQNGIRHSRIRPAHAWTNGRVERLLRTFKEIVGHFARVFLSTRQIDRWCADFRQFYNRDRPHSSYAGLTPDEVAAGIAVPGPARGRVNCFDGGLKWYEFG